MLSLSEKLYQQSHFAPAFYFLAPGKRRALKLLYAVFRVLDDAVDKSPATAPPFLMAWKEAIQQRDPSPLSAFAQENLATDVLDVMKKFDIPPFLLIDFIEKGVALDLVPGRRFQTVSELEEYCYGVAGTVGLACLPIFGVPWQEARLYAIQLGIAVQWINTIRDVGADAGMDRIYLPLEHLKRFRCAEEDLLARTNGHPFLELIRFEASLARSHYEKAQELLPRVWRHQLVPAQIMGRIYVALLAKVEKMGFPVLEKRVSLNIWEKISATLGTFF